MKYLPVFLKLTDRPCLVVGGGDVAYRKIRSLLRAGAKVTVLAPEIVPDIKALVLNHKVIHRPEYFKPEDLEEFHLVISATNQRSVNQSVQRAANMRHLPVNVVDSPDLCSFIFPAIIDRSPVILAISTGGASPVLARLLKARLETLIPSTYGNLAVLADRFRDRVRSLIPGSDERRRFWERVLQGKVESLILNGALGAAETEFEQQLNDASEPSAASVSGFVSLVGAGPGDPELLTLKAFRLLQEADVVVHDRLVSEDILRLARTDATLIDVGKAMSRHTLPQADINQLLVRLAKEGKRVVRLKGGDPFIFGRGGEEIETLSEEQISFQVVPGITAATGCAAYAGIPLTHRDHAQSVAFVTGHARENGASDIDWGRFVDPGQTLVIYMGLQAYPEICERLLSSGMPGDCPAAIIEEGTTVRQRLVIATVATLFEKAQSEGIGSPALILIGDVVQLHAKLSWFIGGSEMNSNGN